MSSSLLASSVYFLVNFLSVLDRDECNESSNGAGGLHVDVGRRDSTTIHWSLVRVFDVADDDVTFLFVKSCGQTLVIVLRQPKRLRFP